jgi:hypothetical protein
MNMTPVAQAVQRQGRGDDTMLVHMTPGEVGGLQALAMAHGGSLSINPNTGLPEAGFLKNLLPTLIGAGLMMIPGLQGVGAGYIGAGVGAAEALRTGDIGKGFLAGLGAFGGANLASGAMAAGAAAPTVTPGATMVSPGGDVTLTSAFTGPGAQAAAQPTFMGNLTQAGQGFKNVFTGQEGAFGKFIGDPAVAANAKTGAAAVPATGMGGAMGAAKTVGAVAAPSLLATPQYSMPTATEEESDYAGPYTPSERAVSYPTDEERRRRTSEFMYFNPSNPVPFAEGGKVKKEQTVSPAEARVFSQIANVQNMAGLPAMVNPNPMVLPAAPAVDRSALVYNPIVSAGGSGRGMAEMDYGFRPLGDMPTAGNVGGGMQFFESTAPFGRFGFSGLARLLGKDPSDPSNYKSVTPTGRVDMSDYLYDPVLGGYVRKPVSMFNKGGSVPQLEDGGFVLTKKAVDGLGRGNNKKGQQVASAGLGAIPIKGAGAKRGPKAGVDDKIKTSIDGKHPALVSNGEAYVPKKQVAKKGGAKAFYALMSKAEKAADKRKRA